MNYVRWYAANWALRFAFWLMPESKAKNEYYDAVKSVSIRIYGVVMESRP